MAKITDYLVQDADPNEYDDSVLHVKLTPVNMRLFRSSPFYRQIVADVINYMDAHLNMTFEDYYNVRGVCAANLGLNFNIIGYKLNGKTKFCINPKIVARSEDGITSETKCGSLKGLDKTIKVFRHNLIDLEYFDLKGQRIVEKNIGRLEGGFTIQHEVDQANGVTVLDKELKQDVVVQVEG